MTTMASNGKSLVETRLAWIAVAVLGVLLTLGTLITTYRVGMVDPIWPTEPWFLLNNWREPSAGYLIEHIHRVAGYLAGLAILATALASWRKAPIAVGWIPLVLISVGIAFAMTSIDRVKARVDPIGAVNLSNLYGGLGLAILSFLIVLGGWLMRADGTDFGHYTRLAALLAYGAVILQGLLGGLRVYLNALMGDTLATIHGGFGQCVMALATTTAVLASLNHYQFSEQVTSKRMTRFLGFLLIAVLMQLAWAVVVRHQGSGWAQRLHVLFAVLISGGLGMAAVMAREEGARHLRPIIMSLTGVLLVQVALGVEAWMGKFGTGMPVAPEARTATEALLRTSHSLTGALFLSMAASAWVRSLLPAIVPSSYAQTTNNHALTEGAFQ
jgi:heme A synthase